MFILRVHSVDTDHPITTEESEFTSSTARAKSNPNPNLIERKGVAYLYRRSSQSWLPNSTYRSNSLFVVAVPNYLASLDFIQFCESHIQYILEVLFIRNDAMEDRYSVLIKLVDQSAADGFYSSLNGKRFSPAEAEVCHIIYMRSVEYTEYSEIMSEPPSGFTELPTCPICLERLDPDTSGILSTLCDHSFQCSCTSKWTYLSCQVCRLCQQQDEIPACSICGTMQNLWICMICGFLGCGRYKEGHAIRHWKDTQHCYSLDLSTQQIWDYVGDSYVHRLNQSKADGKSAESAETNRCMSLEGNCGTCGCSEDSGISRAIYDSKMDATVSEYNDLLASQLKTQRQYYESLLVEAKSRRDSSVSEVVEKAVASKMQDIQTELDKCEVDKNAVADINRKLIKEQETWRKKVKEIEEREIAASRSKEEQITELEEQIRDVRVFIEAQKTLGDMRDTDGIREGTVIGVQPKESASARRQKKSGRRRN